jgi:uncharacterized membrane protein (DUF485 family)
MYKDEMDFEKLMKVYDHIGAEERHFNELELEYRKLASQWLLVALGAIGFVLTKQEELPVNNWLLVIGICVAASVGIFVLWMLDLKVYHELLHAAFKEGVYLEYKYPDLLPKVRINMIKSQNSGDIITKVMLFYFFSILLLISIANISVWMYNKESVLVNVAVNIFSIIMLLILYGIMINKSDREFKKEIDKIDLGGERSF